MKLDLKLFLTLPFTKQAYYITEGWYYSDQEKLVHDYSGHGAIDFALPRGTPVYAPASGWATSSYSSALVREWTSDGKRLTTQRVWRGKKVFMGYGYVVRMFHPEQNLYTQYGHLEKISPTIPFRKPRKREEKYIAIGLQVLNSESVKTSNHTVFIKRGEQIGTVGDTGLGWGYQDYPQRPNPKKYPSWDEPHLHLEVFWKTRYGKRHFLDPYGIKGKFEDYPDSLRKSTKLGNKSDILWHQDNSGLPEFALQKIS